MKPLTDAQIGWVAGLIDLRGYLSDRPSSQADHRLPTLAITLATVDGEPSPIIDWLCRRTAVNAIPVGKGYNRAGCGKHCPEPHVHVANTYHRWIVGGAKATAVLRATQPLLVAKADQVRELLRLGGQYKPASWAQMKRLGWPVPELAA